MRARQGPSTNDVEEEHVTTTEQECLCGCGGAAAPGSRYRSGHDLRQAMGLIRHTFDSVEGMADVAGAAAAIRKENVGRV